MPHALHSTTFKWNPKEPLLPIYKDLVEEKSKAPATEVASKAGTNSISLIAGAYGESSEDEDSSDPSPEKEKTGGLSASCHFTHFCLIDSSISTGKYCSKCFSLVKLGW